MTVSTRVLSAAAWPGEWWWSLAEGDPALWTGGLATIAALALALTVPVTRRISAWRANRIARSMAARRQASELLPVLARVADSLHRLRTAFAEAAMQANPQFESAGGEIRGLPELRAQLVRSTHIGQSHATRLTRLLATAEEIDRWLGARLTPASAESQNDYRFALERVTDALRDMTTLQLAMNMLAFDIKPRDASAR